MPLACSMDVRAISTVNCRVFVPLVMHRLVCARPAGEDANGAEVPQPSAALLLFAGIVQAEATIAKIAIPDRMSLVVFICWIPYPILHS